MCAFLRCFMKKGSQPPRQATGRILAFVSHSSVRSAICTLYVVAKKLIHHVKENQRLYWLYAYCWGVCCVENVASEGLLAALLKISQKLFSIQHNNTQNNWCFCSINLVKCNCFCCSSNWWCFHSVHWIWDPKLAWDLRQRGFDLDVLLVMVLIRNLLLLVD